MAQPFVLIGKVMQKRAANVQVAVGKIARTAAAVIGEAVTRATPVDTGAARSNWIMTIDEIATYIIPAYAPYPKTHQDVYSYHKGERESGRKHIVELGRKDESANLGAVLSQHFTALQRFDPEVNDTIYIANNLPYIGLLDAGYSPQTEAGFVARSVDEGIEAIRGMKLMEA